MMKLTQTLFASLLVAFSAVAAFAHDYKLGDLDIHHPASRAMIEGAEVAGGFMTITNHSKTDDRLIKVSSDAAKMIQLHEMKVENDVMKMGEVPGGIVIPAGGTVELKRGGLHVMFMGVSTPFKEGDKIKAVLTFEKAGDIAVEFAVGPANGEAAKSEHDAHKHHQN
ncbi:copper chaperone PCu(A)C [Rhizobium alvei]|uniref:Copper chaperone PCu(A)C n=1 Tax=Rhizobium alvei TaxID=1132659 RepID=A0ABT8YHK0_9HYPH|nr:copper chaperone PCu(A)C [Rhizobium alvei]MDO6962798.1 copper chaperone PCu(A)C [Rhizobium alvei]